MRELLWYLVKFTRQFLSVFSKSLYTVLQVSKTCTLNTLHYSRGLLNHGSVLCTTKYNGISNLLSLFLFVLQIFNKDELLNSGWSPLDIMK